MNVIFLYVMHLKTSYICDQQFREKIIKIWPLRQFYLNNTHDKLSLFDALNQWFLTFLLHGPLKVKKISTDPLFNKICYWWTPECQLKSFQRVQYFTIVIFTDPLDQACQTGGPRAACGPFACFVRPE